MDSTQHQLWCCYPDDLVQGIFYIGEINKISEAGVQHLADSNPEINYFVIKVSRVETTDI